MRCIRCIRTYIVRYIVHRTALTNSTALNVTYEDDRPTRFVVRSMGRSALVGSGQSMNIHGS